jgi:tetratricopeptide (TPR) repeat protein
MEMDSTQEARFLQLAFDVVADLAPDELPMFKSLSNRYLAQSTTHGTDKAIDDTLWFGVGKATPLLTPVLLVVSARVIVASGEERARKDPHKVALNEARRNGWSKDAAAAVADAVVDSLGTTMDESTRRRRAEASQVRKPHMRPGIWTMPQSNSGGSVDAKKLGGLFEETMAARTWADARQLIENHPELIGQETETNLAHFTPIEIITTEEAHELGDAATRIGDQYVTVDLDALKSVTYHRLFLLRCREIGLVAALVEFGGPRALLSQRLLAIDADVAEYWETGQRAPLQHAVEIWRTNPTLDAADSTSGTDVLNDLGISLLNWSRGTADDRESADWAWQILQTVIEYADQSSRETAPYFGTLGVAAVEMYHRTSDPAYIDRAVAALRNAVKLSAPTSTELGSDLFNLGSALMARFKVRAVTDDLTAASEAFRASIDCAAPGTPQLVQRHHGLGLALEAQYRQTGDRDHLNASIDVFETAAAAPKDSTDLRIESLIHLGLNLRQRQLLTGSLDDVDRAVDAWEQAANLAQDAAARSVALGDLGLGLRDRYDRTGDRGDLERAIATLEKALSTSGTDQSARAAIVNNMCLAFLDLYYTTGEVASLDRSIAAGEQAVAGSNNSSQQPVAEGNLALALSERASATGRFADLWRAIDLLEAAVDEMNERAPERIHFQYNLGRAWLQRFDLTHDLSHVDFAIDALDKVVAQTSSDLPQRPRHLFALASALLGRSAGRRQRWPVGGWLPMEFASDSESSEQDTELDDGDLDRAIELLTQGITASSVGTADIPIGLATLAAVHREKYAMRKDGADLEAAIQCSQRALEVTSVSSSVRPAVLTSLGNDWTVLYKQSREVGHLKRAIESLRDARTLINTRFRGATIAYKLGSQQSWQTRQGVDRDLVWLELELARRSPGRASESRRAALEVCEAGKSRVLSEALGRGELPVPRSVPVALAQRERELLAEVSTLDTVELGGFARLEFEASSAVAARNRRNDVGAALSAVWDDMSKLDADAAAYVSLRRGDSPTWQDLAALADELGDQTALLSMSMLEDRLVLFIMRAGWEAPVVIDDAVTEDIWSDALRRFEREVRIGRSRRGETWDQGLRPLLSAAGRHLAGVERVILAPAADAHLVPWFMVAARAGWRASDGSLMPLVVLPALAVLVRLRAAAVSRVGGVLIVGNPTGDLPWADREAREVAALLGAQPLIGPAATRDAVLRGLRQASWAHFAAHATFTKYTPGGDSPLDSAILLADGRLSAREIMQQQLHLDLLVLSGCETGSMDSGGGEEFLGLTQAFLQAGARSLVVSLWPVDDAASCSLLVEMYRALSRGEDKAKALASAISVGVGAGEVPADSCLWAAFQQIGVWETAPGLHHHVGGK